MSSHLNDAPFIDTKVTKCEPQQYWQTEAVRVYQTDGN